MNKTKQAAKTMEPVTDNQQTMIDTELEKQITQDLENEDYNDAGIDDDDVQVPLLYTEIEEIKSIASKASLTAPLLLSFADLDNFEAVQSHVRLIEKRLGFLDHDPATGTYSPKAERQGDNDVFIKVSANNDGFQGLRYPDIALINGQVCAILHNYYQPIEDIIRTVKTFKIFRKGTGTTAEYYLTLAEEQAELFMMRINVKVSDQTHNEFQMVNVKYLRSILAPYTFARTWLPDGVHEVTEFKSIEGRFLVGVIEGKQYYLTQKQYDALKSNQEDSRPLNLIIDGQRTYKTPEGELKVVRNEYIEGHRPAMFFAECMETLVREAVTTGHFGAVVLDNQHVFVQKYLSELHKDNTTPKIIELITTDLILAEPENERNKTDKKFKARKSIAVEPPIEVRVLGISSCKQSPANRLGFQLMLEFKGNKYTTVPNTQIADNRANRMFDNVDFTNDEHPVTMMIPEIEYWESTNNGKACINKKYVIRWHTPEAVQTHDPKYNKLAAKFKKS